VQHAEHVVAVAFRVDQDAQPHQVVDVVEVASAHHHLLVDRVVVLGSAVHRRLDLVVGKVLLDLLDDRGEVLIAQGRPLGDELHDLGVDLGLDHRERQILQFPLDRVHAQPVGQRGIDLQGVARDANLLVLAQRADGAHVVQPVGQLDDQDADVAAHRDDHLADGLGLRRLPVHDLVELRHPVDHGGDLLAEVG
jgi:hypothetical protein